MAELKTKQNDASVEKFLDGVADEKKRNDCLTVLEIMKQVTRSEPKMWGTSKGARHTRRRRGEEEEEEGLKC